jgi:osmoprotectant transport system ATP-binding protein
MSDVADKALVEFHNVSFSLSGTNIITDLNLTVERGETLVLLGESGCGKTTTLKLVNRLFEPSAGEVRLKVRRRRAGIRSRCGVASVT